MKITRMGVQPKPVSYENGELLPYWTVRAALPGRPLERPHPLPWPVLGPSRSSVMQRHHRALREPRPVSFLVDKLLNVIPRTSLQVLRTVVLGPRGCYGQDGGISPSHPGPTWRTGPTQLPRAPHTPSSCSVLFPKRKGKRKKEKKRLPRAPAPYSFSQPSRVAPS